MTRHTQYVLVACAAAATLLSLPSEASAQAWVRESGSGFVDLSFRNVAGTGFYDGSGEIAELPDTFRTSTLNLYSEVGILDRWLQATLTGEIYRRNQLDNQGRTESFGDLRLGLWSGLIEGPVRLTVGAQFGLPTGDPAPMALGLDEDAGLIAASLPTGDGEFDVELDALLGYGLGGGSWPLEHYAVLQGGYWVRTMGFSDGVTYRAELGSRLPRGALDRVWLIAKVYGVEPLGRNDASAAFSGFGDGVMFTAAGVEGRVMLVDGLQLSASVEGAFRGANIIAAAPWKVGLSYEF